MYLTHDESYARPGGDSEDSDRATATNDHFRSPSAAQASETPRIDVSTNDAADGVERPNNTGGYTNPHIETFRRSSDDPASSRSGNDPTISPQEKNNDRTPKSWWVRTKCLWVRLLDYLQDSWFLEVAACVLALSLLAAEIGVLSAFDGRRMDAWPWRWSLNSAVALFTTLLESLLLFALVSCLGQMKWLWFVSSQEEEKRLIWIDYLARSNTPVGALSLLLFHATTWRYVQRLCTKELNG